MLRWGGGRQNAQPPETAPVIVLALLLAGYSIFCAAALAVLQRRHNDAGARRPFAQAMALLTLALLAGLQGAHVAWLYADVPAPHSRLYTLGLFAVAPCFFLFSRDLLTPARAQPRPRDAWHALPMLAALLLPDGAARPAAFLVGAGYLLWLGRSLVALRPERTRFRAEIGLLGTAFLLAIAVALAGVAPGLLPDKHFTALYAIAIGLAFLLVQATLHQRPQLEAEVQEAAQSAYQHTTLARIDCDVALARLSELMQSQRLFVDPALSLPSLAARLDLTTHQLSELLNSRLGKSFARYVREQRIEAAKSMLCDEPSASVLSVGLAVGFAAQSNFYEAFRDIEGMTPGQYRKLRASGRGR